ncbi:hypothetical protein RsS62_23950 [Rhizobium dioscoreae]|uniref:HEPN domain-containing protein n=1 Tax=Rhizobium dioscoreae TaxID=2653122 RepID=UPI00126062EE|nr:HEPN domain-containing protein [Rhizobium dioscoreae]GES43143.1 hypothetical protein RsS62_23950 [Rhizobium dioscoreae]
MTEVGIVPEGDERDENAFVPDSDFGNACLTNMLDLFITPEVMRRQEAGLLPVPLYLEKGQVIFRTDGSAPVVRINNEARVVMNVRVNPSVRNMTVGEEISLDDIDEFHSISLPEDEEDFGHFTFVNFGARAFVSFDFHYNRSTSRSLVSLANDYADAAELCLKNNLYKPYIDGIFNACELAARARLVTEGHEGKGHGATHSRVNLHGKLGNINSAFVDLFNKAGQARSSARYGEARQSPELPENALEILRAEIAFVKERFHKR